MQNIQSSLGHDTRPLLRMGCGEESTEHQILTILMRSRRGKDDATDLKDKCTPVAW